jgi:hypothetical protein
VDEIEEEDVGDEDFVKLVGGKGTSRKVVQNLEAPSGLRMVRCVPKKDKAHSVVDYKTMSNDEYIEVHRSLVPHRTDQRTAFDHRFWKIEQQDIYESICLSPRRHMCAPQKRVDLQYIAEHEDKFGQGVLDIIDAKGLECILTFRHDWNEEAILQFYATCYFTTETPQAVHWMTNGKRLSCTFEEFASLLELDGT